ncbi:MAG: glycosyl transferase, group 1 [uncultured bacterium]|nr:MAG: glycosyl transferase, group 1 [uncultured bacterium]
MTTRKNVLILGYSYAIQFIDVCNQYVKLFDQNHYKVTVAYLSGKPDENARSKTLAEEVIFLDFAKKDLRGIKISAIKKLLTLCQQEKFSMVICHRYKPIYIMLWVAQFCSIPALFFVMHAMKTFHHVSRKLLIALLARKNMYFVGVSNATRDDMRRDLWCISAERVITLYNCIDMELTESALLSREEARHTLGLPKDAFVFGTVGRLVPDKDQKTLIHAFAKIKSHCPKATLIIMGNGALEHDLKNLTHQLKLTHDVIFTGFVPEASCYFKAFDVFILPSIEEAFGRVLLEAMTAKIPVVGTRIDGIPEVIQDAGIIVEPQNPEALASVMMQMTHKSSLELTQWGEQIYEHVKKHFSLPTFNNIFWNIPINAL